MSDRNWSLFARAGIVFLLLTLSTIAMGTLHSYQAENRVARDDKAKADAAYEREQIKAECIRVSGVVTAECAANADRAANHAAQPDHDLKAQQDMAQWAYLGVWTAVIGVVITGAGVVYVAMTLNQTRQSTSAAIDSAKAAKDAISAERAWLVIKGGAAGVTDDKRHAIFNLVWTNAGRTPAIRALAQMSAGIRNPTDPIPNLDPDFTPEDGRAICGPNLDFVSSGPVFDAAALLAVFDGSKHLILRSAVQYYDVWGNGPFHSTATFRAIPSKSYDDFLSTGGDDAFTWRVTGKSHDNFVT